MHRQPGDGRGLRGPDPKAGEVVRDFRDKVAVITGGASGIGYALAQVALSEGAKVVIADRRAEALEAARARLAAGGGDVIAVKCDVARSIDVEALAAVSVAHFGAVHLLFNNAGAFAPCLTWETPLKEYERLIGVNLLSVVHGLRAFVPLMIQQADECHVINTASGAGLMVTPGFATYAMTKHAVVALTEALYLDLMAQKIDNIGVTLAMPGAVRSEILYSGDRHAFPMAKREACGQLGGLDKFMKGAISNGMAPLTVAMEVFAAIRRNDLYVLPNFADSTALDQTLAVATGRAKGENAYPKLMAQLMPHLGAMSRPAS